MHTKEQIDNYFRHVWVPNIGKYKWSGWRLISQVPLNATVLDVGCGYNPFKEFFGDRLVGIDPFNSAADYEVSLEDFSPPWPNPQFDVIFCLGSINFGHEEQIIKQLETLTKFCKSGTKIFWRQNPGRQDHENEECKNICFYDWSFEKNIEFTDRFGFRLEMLAWDDNRIYAEWVKR